jgi:hypothetical protein
MYWILGGFLIDNVVIFFSFFLFLFDRDPFSTPARRRRIIADLARVVLRNYFIKACDNVHQIRVSIIIQCAWRCYFARKLLFQLWLDRRTRSAILIQSVWRMKLARMLRIRLWKAYILKMKKKIAKFVADYMRRKRARLGRKKLLAKRKAEKEDKLHYAAVMIQKNVRMFLCRQNYQYLLYEYYQALKLKNFAARFIQRQWSRYKVAKKYLLMKRRYFAMRIINRRVKTWWKRRKLKRHRAAIVIQKYVRRYLAQCLYARLLAIARKPRTPTPPPRLPTPSPPEPMIEEPEVFAITPLLTKETIEIHVELKHEILFSLIHKGLPFLVQWCIAQSIIRYSNSTGYAPGAVVQQVIHSVEALNAPPSTTSLPVADSKASSANDRVIVIKHWEANEGDESTVPEEILQPMQWEEAKKHPMVGGTICFALRSRHNTATTMTTSATSTMDSTSTITYHDSIEIHIIQEVLNTIEEIKSIDYCVSLIIPPNPSQRRKSTSRRPSFAVNSSTEHKQGGHHEENLMPILPTLSLDEDYLMNSKLYFKDAIIFLPPKQPQSLPASRPMTSIPAKEVTFDDSTELSDDENPLDEEEPRIIRIHLEEPLPEPEPEEEEIVPPLPPPPQIDYDAMAKRIQVNAYHYSSLCFTPCDTLVLFV